MIILEMSEHVDNEYAQAEMYHNFFFDSHFEIFFFLFFLSLFVIYVIFI